jgi:tripartite-type tricarboxylate transporter receptor subunit TctC
VHPYEHEKLPYDVERDLLPIASVSAIILAISSSASLKVDSLGELVELARAQPGKLNAAAANGNADFLLFGFPACRWQKSPIAISCRHPTISPRGAFRY